MGAINFKSNDLHDGVVYGTTKDRVSILYYSHLDKLLEEMNDDFKRELNEINYVNEKYKIKYGLDNNIDNYEGVDIFGNSRNGIYNFDELFDIKQQSGYYSGDAFSIEIPEDVLRLRDEESSTKILSTIEKDKDKEDKSYIHSKDFYNKLFGEFVSRNVEIYLSQRLMEWWNNGSVEELTKSKLEKLQYVVEKYDYFLKKLASELGYKEITPGWVTTEKNVELNKVEGWDEEFENMYQEYVNDILEYNVIEDDLEEYEEYEIELDVNELDEDEIEFEVEYEDEYDDGYEERNKANDMIKYLINPTKCDSQDFDVVFLRNYVEKNDKNMKENIERYLKDVRGFGENETIMVLYEDVDLIKNSIFNKIDELRKNDIKKDMVISSLEIKYKDFDVISTKDLEKLKRNFNEIKDNIEKVKDMINEHIKTQNSENELIASNIIDIVSRSNVFNETINLIDEVKNDRVYKSNPSLHSIRCGIKDCIFNVKECDLTDFEDLLFDLNNLEKNIDSFVDTESYIEIKDNYSIKEREQYKKIANDMSVIVDEIVRTTLDENIDKLVESNEVMQEFKNIKNKKRYLPNQPIT